MALLASCATEERLTLCNGDDVTVAQPIHRVTVAAFIGNTGEKYQEISG